MSLFDIVGKDIVMRPETLAVREFRDIWDDDKSEDKSVAYRKLCYVFHVCDMKSPYRSYSEEERMFMVKQDVLGDIKIDGHIELAVEKYVNLSKSKAGRLLEDAYDAMDKLRDYFKNADLNKKDKNGKLTYSSKDMISNLKELAGVFRSVKELEREVEKEDVGSSRVRGGAEKGYFEDDV